MSTKDYLSRISGLIVVIAIYLYFTAWVYIHWYYWSFGVSTISLNIDYGSYLVYSWNVLSAPPFLDRTGVILGGAFIGAVLWPKVSKWLKPALVAWVREKGFALLLVLMTITFPYLYFSASSAAFRDFSRDRGNRSALKTIQFLFKQGDALSPAVTLDSVARLPSELVPDTRLIRKDSNQQLKLLGETDNDYVVLNQPPYDDTLKVMPTGSVYLVHKADLLLTKIILRSTN